MSARAKVMTFRTLVRTIIIVAAFPLFPMIVSGNWAWWEAWIYALVSILGFVISRVLAARQHPDLLEERARSMDRKDAKPWDKLLAPILAFGALWAYLATPVLLDSLWAFTPAFLLVGVLILRTALEDRTLQQELPGYKEFTEKTRFRLIPALW